MKVVKNSIKYFFKTDWSKWIIVFLFFISLLSLGAYRDIVDLFTALLRSYSDNSFIAFIFLILAVNTLYLYKTFFNSNNYLIRTNNRFKYLKYTLLTNLIISFIYYLISFLFVLLFTLFKIKGGIDLNIIFNYSKPGYLYFLYHYFKVFIINFNFPISLDPNAIYKFNILFLEIYVGLLINFIFYNKYRILCFFILPFIILFIISFKLQLINILLFVIILLLSVKLLKIQDME